MLSPHIVVGNSFWSPAGLIIKTSFTKHFSGHFFVESNPDLGSYINDDIPYVRADDTEEAIMSLKKHQILFSNSFKIIF